MKFVPKAILLKTLLQMDSEYHFVVFSLFIYNFYFLDFMALAIDYKFHKK